MSLGSQVRAGAAFVELKSKDSSFTRGLRMAERRLQAFGRASTRVGRMLGLTGAAFAPVGLAALKFAADAEESESRFRAVFGRMANDVGKWADQLAARVGRARVEVIDSLSSMQSFFLGLGLDAGQASAMSKQLTELAIDFASFNNLTDEDAMTRFIAALSGSSEVLAKYGINIKQAALQQELLRMGITKSWSAVTEQEKAMARYNIILRTMTTQGAVGDATRTAGSFTNQMKRLRAELIDIATAIGKSIMPPLSRLLNIINPILRRVGDWIDLNRKTVAIIAAIITAVAGLGVGLLAVGLAFGVVGFALTGFLAVMSALGAIAGVVGSAIAALISPIGAVVAAVGIMSAAIIADFVASGKAADMFKRTLTNLLNGSKEVFGGIKDAIAKGDIELAFEIVTTSIKVLWGDMILDLRKKWDGFQKWFFSSLGDLLQGFSFYDAGVAMHILSDLSSSDSRLLEVEIRELRDTLKDLIEKSRMPGGIYGPPEPPEDPFNGLGAFGTGNSSSGRSTRGTFNNFGLQGLASPVEKSIEENTKRTAQAAETIARNTSNGGLSIV